MKKQFDTTKNLYGVEPKILASMSYTDALKQKYIFIKKYIDTMRDAETNFYKNGGMSYYDFSIFVNEIKKREKALELVKFQLDEIGIDHRDIEVVEKTNENI